MNIVSSFQEVGKFPSQHTVIAANASISGGGRHRILIPQQKRMLSSPLTHVIKRKRNSEYGNESPGSHVRDEIEKLKKEKLLLTLTLIISFKISSFTPGIYMRQTYD